MAPTFHQLVEDLDRSIFDFLRYERVNSIDTELNAMRHSLIRFVDWMKTTAKDTDTMATDMEAKTAKAAADAIEALRRIAALEERVAALEGKVGELSNVYDDILAQHGQRLDALETNFGDLKGRFGRAAAQPAAKPVAATVRRPAPPVTYKSFELEGTSGSQKKVVIELLSQHFAEQQGRLVLGSSPQHAHLVIKDPGVDPKHASFTVRESRFYIQDLGSSGGTMVNGQKIRSYLDHAVNLGDTVSLGRLSFKLRPPTRKATVGETRVGFTRLLGR
jgi:uncharacterized coiled-coil protein SlyX